MIFFDTGSFIARFIENDQYHDLAVNQWKVLEAKGGLFYTSNFILDETFTLLARWTGYPFASKTAKSIYHSNSLIILRPDLHDEVEALNLFERYANQKVSFTDCISCVLMRKNSIQQVFTFDKHFLLWKFKVLPGL